MVSHGVNPESVNSVYTLQMEPAATTRWIPNALELPHEIEDFDAVVRLYWPKVFRFALASLRDRDAAETVAQDCFLRAYKSREGFRGDASLNTWLMQIAVNLVRDHVRNRRLMFWKRTATGGVDFDLAGQWLADGGASPEERAQAKEKLQAVWGAAEGLSERQRTVFLLRFVEDLDLLEIASITGLQEGTVKAHLFRAVNAVREKVGERK